MKLLKNKKGFTVSDLAPIAVAFVAVAIALSLGMDVLGQMKTNQCNDINGYNWNATANECQNSTGGNAVSAGEATYEFNATTNGLDAGNELASWLPTIALIVAAAVIIGIIVVYLARRFT